MKIDRSEILGPKRYEPIRDDYRRRFPHLAAELDTALDPEEKTPALSYGSLSPARPEPLPG